MIIITEYSSGMSMATVYTRKTENILLRALSTLLLTLSMIYELHESVGGECNILLFHSKFIRGIWGK